jgi:Transcription factor WhiB
VILMSRIGTIHRPDTAEPIYWKTMMKDREGVTSLADVVSLLPRWTQQTWMTQAACRGRTGLFFPPFGEQPDAREAREAVAGRICRVCPVLVTCREYARRHREQGFWGGENDEQRLAVRRRGRVGPAAPAGPHDGVVADAHGGLTGEGSG